MTTYDCTGCDSDATSGFTLGMPVKLAVRRHGDLEDFDFVAVDVEGVEGMP
jgi:hypothetical protein